MVEILKQPQYKPMPIAEQVVIIWCGSKGHLDALPVSSLAAYEEALLAYVRDEFPEILEGISSSGEISEEIEASLVSVVGNFTKDFSAQQPQN